MSPNLIAVSVSGGKDSTACALLALEQTATPKRFVFADTGNEHETTYDYIRNYLPTVLGMPIDVVTADFTRKLAGKRAYIEKHWSGAGVPDDFIARTLALLSAPTGNPFLDLCMWKGRFPSRMAQFCTQELKRYPLEEYLLERQMEAGSLESWQGVRRDESQGRRNALEVEPMPEGWIVRRPIVDWTVEQVVAYILKCGVELNPLYKQGMGRVGCMPCINCRKGELAEIASRFPHHIDRIREWEAIVGQAAKRGFTSFFTDGVEAGETNEECAARLSIDERVEWAKTDRGGKQYNLLREVEPSPECSSIYGLCE